MNMKGAALLVCYLTATALGAPADLTAPVLSVDDTTSTLQQNAGPADKTDAPTPTFSNLPKILPPIFLNQQPSSILSGVFNNTSSSTNEGLIPQAEVPEFVASAVKQTGATDIGKVFWVPFVNTYFTKKQT